jgi:hypothetical protein
MAVDTERVYDPNGAALGGTRTLRAERPEIAVGENMMMVRNRVQWGPIIAGLITGLATLIVLTILGLAIGTSAFEPGKSDGLGTAAGIWGAVSAIIAFFLGGWVAAKTAAVGGRGAGMINGFLVGATVLALILYLTTTGLSNLLGTVGNNIGDIANVVQDQAQASGVTTTEDAQNQAQDAQAQATEVADEATTALQARYDDAEKGAWGTLIGVLLALGAATLGGMLGYNQRRDLIAGTG